MSTINSPRDNEFELQNLAQPVNSKEKKKGLGAELAHLLLIIKGVLEEITPSTDKTASSKIVHPDFKAADPSAGPSNAQMQAAYGYLMEMLAEMQAKISKYDNKNMESDSEVATALMNQMQAQAEKADQELQKTIKEENQSGFWSLFTKIVEGIVAAIMSTVAVLCGQPELAVIVLSFTALSVSGGMDKITQGIADLVSKALVDMGVPKEVADAVAKVIADITVIVASIVITVATCGAGASATVETAAEEVEEAVAEAGNSLADAAENTESFTQKLESFFSKIGEGIKEKNPLGKLSKTTNLAIVAGTQGFVSTSLGSDLMTAIYAGKEESTTNLAVKTALATIMSLIAALVGAGAGAAVCAGPEMEALASTASKLKTMMNVEGLNFSKVLRALLAMQTLGIAGQVTGQLGLGVTKSELAAITKEQGETRAIITELESLINMNDQQLSANSSALTSEMKSLSSAIAQLGAELNLTGSAVAQVLQA